MIEPNNLQSRRILAALLLSHAPIAMPVLNEIGSGKPGGYCGSFTRRISDLRELGYYIVMTEEYAGTQRHTFYELYNPAKTEFSDN